LPQKQDTGKWLFLHSSGNRAMKHELNSCKYFYQILLENFKCFSTLQNVVFRQLVFMFGLARSQSVD